MSSSISTEIKANGSDPPKPQFLSKKQREELKKKQEDEEKHKEEEKLMEIERKRKEFLSSQSQQKNERDKERERDRRRSRSRSYDGQRTYRRDDRERYRDRGDYRDRKDDRDRDHRGDGDRQRRDDERNVKGDQRRGDEQKNSIKDKDEKDKTDKKFLIDEREIEMIKGKYLGTIKEKKRVIKPSDKFKQVFHFEWDASEDTSKDINPLYAQRHDPKLLFGKGFVGGVDHDFQRKKYGNGDDKKSEKDQRVSLEETMNKPLSEMTERDWKIFKEDQDIMTKGGRIPHPIRNWDEIEDLDPFLRDNIAICGYKRPMPIQMQGIAIGMNCRDMIGLAPSKNNVVPTSTQQNKLL